MPDFRSDLDSDYLFITSGQGIGRVTKKGLDIGIGRPDHQQGSPGYDP